MFPLRHSADAGVVQGYFEVNIAVCPRVTKFSIARGAGFINASVSMISHNVLYVD